MEEISVSVLGGKFTTKLLKGGTGRPLVVLHGAGGLRRGTPWIEALTGKYTVYAPWHPGFGDSEGLEHIDDIRDMAMYYQDLFDALGLSSPAVLGHSFGGMIAAEIAAQSTAAASKLILVSPIGLWRDDVPIPDIFTMSPAEMGALAVGDPDGPMAKAMAVMPEDPQAIAEMMIERTKSLAAAGKFMWPIPDKGLKNRIHRIKVPTLIIWGDSDRMVPTAYAQEFQSRIPGSQLELITGAGHLVPMEQQAAFLAAVEGFLG